MDLQGTTIPVVYEKEKELIAEFLRTWTPSDEEGLYIENWTTKIALGSLNEVRVPLDAVIALNTEYEALARRIQKNTRTYTKLFYEEVDKLVPSLDTLQDNDLEIPHERSAIQVIIDRRRQETQEEGRNDLDYPAALLRSYCLFFTPSSESSAQSIRETTADSLGGLVKIKAIVTRVSDVRPQMQIAGYICELCGHEIFMEVNARSFMPLEKCQSEQCKENQTGGKLSMQIRGSKLLRVQECRIQELPDQVPIGHIPRSMDVHLEESNTRKLDPGDSVIIGGIFLPIPYTGYRAIKAGLLASTYLEAHSIQKTKKSYEEYILTDEIVDTINSLTVDVDFYNKLAGSIAPEIYGHTDVKKALLLQLVGGVTKDMENGVKIRGDINVCLMGDPGVAKSQLLKFMSNIAPRGIYTTGKGSSGVGLTAAVVRDPVTSEMTLEGGALVLADNGLCCIDEFDKMDDNDRTAIHEVMEQQTISIAKAGIHTTLNARTSILAAANPLYGRYNPRRSVTENINLPAALLSRFDIIFLILDRPDSDADRRLAEHVTYVHTHSAHPPSEANLSPEIIREYISQARRIEPNVPKEIAEYVSQIYVKKRQEYKAARKGSGLEAEGTYVSARFLLGVIRISQALARLRHSDIVEENDVEETVRLLNASKDSYKSNTTETRSRREEPEEVIFNTIRDMAAEKQDSGEYSADEPVELLYERIRARIQNKGYTNEQLMSCIQTYERLHVWQLNAARSKLTFVQS